MELARIAWTATVKLTEICQAKPELVREVARANRAWPVMKKKNAKLSDDEKELFAKIQLGADDFIELDPQTARWKLDDSGIIAYELLRYVRNSRASSTDSFFNYGEFGRFAKKELPADFCDDSAPDWWKVAKEVLLFSYPKPHAVDELKNLTPAISSGRQKSPGRLDEDILRKLKSRFMAFARNTF